MKINQKLLERLSQSNVNTDSFFKKIEENKNRKLDPEQFIGSSSTNFRVRNLNQNEEMDQSMMRKSNKFDAMSTATTNFYKHQEETEQTPVIQQKPLIAKHRILNPQQI